MTNLDDGLAITSPRELHADDQPADTYDSRTSTWSAEPNGADE